MPGAPDGPSKLSLPVDEFGSCSLGSALSLGSGFKNYTQSRKNDFISWASRTTIQSSASKFKNHKKGLLLITDSTRQTFSRSLKQVPILEWGGKPYVTHTQIFNHKSLHADALSFSINQKGELTLFLEYVSTSDNCTLKNLLPVGGNTNFVPYFSCIDNEKVCENERISRKKICYILLICSALKYPFTRIITDNKR